MQIVSKIDAQLEMDAREQTFNSVYINIKLNDHIMIMCLYDLRAQTRFKLKVLQPHESTVFLPLFIYNLISLLGENVHES